MMISSILSWSCLEKYCCLDSDNDRPVEICPNVAKCFSNLFAGGNDLLKSTGTIMMVVI